MGAMTQYERVRFLWDRGENTQAPIDHTVEEFLAHAGGRLPTSDPAVTGALWNDNGTVKLSGATTTTTTTTTTTSTTTTTTTGA